MTWDKYHLQEAFTCHGRAAIIASGMPQYIEEKEVDYIGYGIEPILFIVTHHCT